MTKFARVVVWLGGAAFVTSLGFAAWWYIVPLGRIAPWSGWTPVAIDVLLFSLFAIHHSAGVREPVKRWIAPVPPLLQKSVYVWTASALLIAVCAAWRTVGGVVYEIPGPASLVGIAVQLGGVWLTARAVGRIDPLELAGIRPAAGGDSGAPVELQTTGPYAWVRHPVYLGWVLAVFGAPRMTGDRLVFAIVSSAYLVIAVPWEERALMRSFADEYVRYKAAVRWRIVPYVY